MPWWYYDKKELRNTPSIVKDGMDYDVECQYRREGARFIIETGNKMDLGYNTMATGVVYFHRFYMVHSFSSFPKYLTACCALFLAGKVEETPKKAKDIIKMAEKNLAPSEFAKFGEDPKEELLVLERILLQSIKFDLQVDHPYAFLLKYAKSLRGEKQKMQEVLQMAWTFVNDSLCTTLCLQWEAEIIAVAMLYLAAKLSKFDINSWVGKTPGQTRWWEMFVNNVTLELLEDICHQVLDLYSQKRPPNSNILSSNLPSSNAQHSSVGMPSNLNSLLPKNSNSKLNKGINQNTSDSADGVTGLSNSVLPVQSNTMSNISAIPSLYTTNNVTQPPPMFTVPPPALPVNSHEVNTTNVFPTQNQFASIPTHYSGSSGQYNSYGSYGSSY